MTVDWVVLTAAVVGLGLAVIAALGNGPRNVGQVISNSLVNNVTVDSTGTN